MKKQKIKKVLLHTIGRFAEHEANIHSTGWPPPCMGIVYQPKRPKRKNEK